MSSIERFDQLGLSAPLLQTLEAIGYETPSPIQAACIPLLLSGSDMLGEAQTGTGKTAAFALPILSKIDINLRKPQALILAPTRELAIQVAEAFQTYARQMPGFHVLPLYGGQSMVVQLRQLERGAHVIVGTPGRVMDHLERKSLSLDALKTLVLDEADEMLRMGFIDDVEWILEHTPATRQTALFSATMPEVIRRVARTHMRDPQEVKIKAATSTVTAISQRYWQVAQGVNKLDALTRILEVEDDLDAAIIFVRTKTATVELAEKLEARGYSAACLNGDMQQSFRERVIEQLKNKTLDIVIATDVAARGIDVPRVSHVINYDIPYDTEAYVHRIGRTGRAGRKGTAILFIAPREKRMLRNIEQATRQPITPMQLPSAEAVADRRVAQFKQQVVEALGAEKDLAFFEEVVRQIANEQNIEAVEVAGALAFLAQKERPLQLDVSQANRYEQEDRPYRAPSEDRPSRNDRGDRSDRGERPVRSPYAESSSRGDRPERTERAERGERPARDLHPDDRASRAKPSFSGGGVTERYRISVGRTQGVSPKDIVGAIANEAGIDSRHIGQINLFDEYSTVELPSLPADTLSLLQRVRIRGSSMGLALDTFPAEEPRKRFDGPREDRGFPGDTRRPPRSDRPERSDSRPPRSFGDRDSSPRASTTKPYGDRSDRAERPAGDRPRSFTDKPREFGGGNGTGGFGPPRRASSGGAGGGAGFGGKPAGGTGFAKKTFKK